MYLIIYFLLLILEYGVEYYNIILSYTSNQNSHFTMPFEYQGLIFTPFFNVGLASLIYFVIIHIIKTVLKLSIYLFYASFLFQY